MFDVSNRGKVKNQPIKNDVVIVVITIVDMVLMYITTMQGQREIAL
jgi:hypothetical protein